MNRFLGPRIRTESRFVPWPDIARHIVQGWEIVSPFDIRRARGQREWLLVRSYVPWWWRLVDGLGAGLLRWWR
jgi:hypothetical protein